MPTPLGLPASATAFAAMLVVVAASIYAVWTTTALVLVGEVGFEKTLDTLWAEAGADDISRLEERYADLQNLPLDAAVGVFVAGIRQEQVQGMRVAATAAAAEIAHFVRTGELMAGARPEWGPAIEQLATIYGLRRGVAVGRGVEVPPEDIAPACIEWLRELGEKNEPVTARFVLAPRNTKPLGQLDDPDYVLGILPPGGDPTQVAAERGLDVLRVGPDGSWVLLAPGAREESSK